MYKPKQSSSEEGKDRNICTIGYDLPREIEPKVEEPVEHDYTFHGAEQAMSQSCRKIASHSTKSRRESAKNSTAKYREKKKQQLLYLEEEVKKLEEQVTATQAENQKVKQSILVALQALTKMNQRSSNENVEIYNELQIILGKQDSKLPKQVHSKSTGLVDYDQINLLLDTLKYRIGASGKQRQTKLSYHFKSIVNTLFPALYRYILFCSLYKIDFLSEGPVKPIEWDWTNELLDKIQIQQAQKDQVKQLFSQRLNQVYLKTIQGIHILNNIKQKLRQQGIRVQTIEEQIREVLNPGQSANWILFCEKNKYRKELLLDAPFFHPIKREQEDKQQERCNGTKRVKKSLTS